MNKHKRYPKEVKERAVRLVAEHQSEYSSQWAAIVSVAEKLGMTPETLRSWIKRKEIDTGVRSGLTTIEHERIKELEKENKELRRANDILKAASAFFGAELDRQQRK
jgi:transposase-like protein